MADILWESTANRAKGLHRILDPVKPVLVTEYGGAPQAGPPAQILAEHHQGPWAAWFSAHGGSPMLWWFEWIDQNNYWGTWNGLHAYIADVDLREFKGPVALTAQASSQRLWSRAWVRKGQAMGYLMDWQWGYAGASAGTAAPTIANAQVTISRNAAAGTLRLQWWDCERGIILTETTWKHPGGQLRVQAPPFSRHIAWKLQRVGE